MYKNYPEIKSISDKPTKLMVFLHGLGSNGDDLISLVPYIQNRLKEYYFISLHGVENYDMGVFGYQWFSIRDRTPETMRTLIANNIPKLQQQITSKQEELGISNKNTVIVGFSQGAMMGIYLTLVQKKDNAYKAMISFSGMLISPITTESTFTPICIIHGLDDTVVEVSDSIKLEHYCKINLIKHDSFLIPNLTHSIDGAGIEFMIKFLDQLS